VQAEEIASSPATSLVTPAKRKATEREFTDNRIFPHTFKSQKHFIYFFLKQSWYTAATPAPDDFMLMSPPAKRQATNPLPQTPGERN
jgi:hypothetical protein